MSKKILDLKERIIQAADQVRDISNLAILENREYTVDENAKIAVLDSEMSNDMKRLDTEDRQQAIEMRMARERGSEMIDKRMREAGIHEGGSTTGHEFISHTGERAHFLTKADKVGALHGGQRLANGTGQMVRAMICGVNSRTPREVQTAMNGGNNNLGGLLVPNYLSGDVIDLMRSRAVLGLAGCPTIILEGSDNTIARVVGEVTPEVKAEMAAFTPSDITLGSVGLFPRTVGCLIETSR